MEYCDYRLLVRIITDNADNYLSDRVETTSGDRIALFIALLMIGITKN